MQLTLLYFQTWQNTRLTLADGPVLAKCGPIFQNSNRHKYTQNERGWEIMRETSTHVGIGSLVCFALIHNGATLTFPPQLFHTNASMKQCKQKPGGLEPSPLLPSSSSSPPPPPSFAENAAWMRIAAMRPRPTILGCRPLARPRGWMQRRNSFVVPVCAFLG